MFLDDLLETVHMHRLLAAARPWQPAGGPDPATRFSRLLGFTAGPGHNLLRTLDEHARQLAVTSRLRPAPEDPAELPADTRPEVRDAAARIWAQHRIEVDLLADFGDGVELRRAHTDPGHPEEILVSLVIEGIPRTLTAVAQLDQAPQLTDDDHAQRRRELAAFDEKHRDDPFALEDCLPGITSAHPALTATTTGDTGLLGPDDIAAHPHRVVTPSGAAREITVDEFHHFGPVSVVIGSTTAFHPDLTLRHLWAQRDGELLFFDGMYPRPVY